MTVFIVLGSFYFGVALHEFYKSFLMGQPTRECLINALVWPVDFYAEAKEMIRRNYIDKEGP